MAFVASARPNGLKRADAGLNACSTRTKQLAIGNQGQLEGASILPASQV